MGFSPLKERRQKCQMEIEKVQDQEAQDQVNQRVEDKEEIVKRGDYCLPPTERLGIFSTIL